MVTRRNKIKNPWQSADGQAGEVTDFVNTTTSPASSLALYTSNITHARGAFDWYAVPEEKLTEELMHRYFSDAGMLFPYIHETTFRENYNHMRKYGSRQMRLSWLGIFNMLLAVATNMTRCGNLQRNERTAEAHTYYQRAVGLCDRIFLRGSSVEIGLFQAGRSTAAENLTGQSTVSLAHDPISAGDSEGCSDQSHSWPCCERSHADRVALAASLTELRPIRTRNAKKSLVHVHALRQVSDESFWSNTPLILARIISMTFGLPPKIPNSNVVLDLPTQFDPSFEVGSEENGNGDLSLGVFNSTMYVAVMSGP